MKKMILVLILGILFTGINVYAAGGDLIVDGKIGVGTTEPRKELDVSGDLILDGQLLVGTTGGMPKALIISTNQRGLSVGATSTTNNTNNVMKGAIYSVTIDGSVSEDRLIGQEATLSMMSDYSGTVPGGVAADYTFQIGTPDTTGTTDVTEVIGLKYTLNRHYQNTRTYNVANSYGFMSVIQEGTSTATPINVTNHYHQYLADPGALTKINMTNLYGMYIEKMTLATNNYGIVLDGDGAIGDYGAAIVLGASQNGYLYGKTDGVYVYNGTDETLISPHDPETGEWIYYSRNVKTGRTVRVNMEELIKDMEKLTGKKYLIESFVNEQ